MATCQAPTSPVITRLITRLTDAYSGSQHRYECRSFCDLDFLESGVSRCISDSASGGDFLQRHGDGGRLEIGRTLFFKALKSERRLDNLVSVNLNLAHPMASQLDDPFAGIAELADFDISAGDGHFHEAACHDPHKQQKPEPGKKRANGDRQKQAKKLQTGHYYILNMRSHHLRHLALAELRPGGGNEHDMHVLKRLGAGVLRFGAKAGRKSMIVWDRACIDFRFWDEAKRLGVYFVSREKANMKIGVIGLTPGFDKDDPRNAGVTADELVCPGGGGTMIRRVTYTAAKEANANFICLAHNLMMLLEDAFEKLEDVSNVAERKRKSEREAEARESGAGYVATLIQRLTVRSVKFVRWLRNFMCCETGPARESPGPRRRAARAPGSRPPPQHHGGRSVRHRIPRHPAKPDPSTRGAARIGQSGGRCGSAVSQWRAGAIRGGSRWSRSTGSGSAHRLRGGGGRPLA